MANKNDENGLSFGEGIIHAGNKEYRVLFNNRALAEAEQQMGKSVIGVARGYAQGDSGITELAHLLRAGMQASQRANKQRGRVVTMSDAFKVMDKVGFTEVATVVMRTLSDVLGYDPGEDDSDELDDDEMDLDPND